MDQKSALTIAKNYLNYLKQHNIDVRNAYLFGSYATGTSHADSDIDLAIIMHELSNNFITQIELMKLGRHIDSRIEPHPFDESDFTPSNPFANEVLKNGVQVL
ncbi:nucleotidyltransferase domain-containing protein [candidate division KSB1 bacterium]|nr:nucleotidyltransferase domain-containing protein [candidate division KSB1 bacterium]